MSSITLGKRKEREEGQATHGSTLFVSNLPYQVTSVDLQTLFSEIAPIRSAFVVLEQGTGLSKGVGYVSFAAKEDVQSAYEKITKEGLRIADRTLRVQFADPKSKEKDKTERKPQPAPRGRPTQDPLAIRTIVVSGLPPSIDSKSLWKKFRKYGAEKVEWPVRTDHGDDPSAAHVIFNTPAAALDSVDKLHAHVFKGALLSVALKKRLNGLSKFDKSDHAKHSSKSTNPSRGSRLIVRNIPFDITEQDLRAIFLPYGPIHSIIIPTLEDDNGENTNKKRKQLIKGFAFVWMLSKKDAEGAIQGCNGMVVRAGMAESIRLDKQLKKKQRRLDKMKESIEEGSEKTAEEHANRERTIAVDWALSKDKWEEERTKYEDFSGDEDDENSFSSDSRDSSSNLEGSDSDESDAEYSEDPDLNIHSPNVNDGDGLEKRVKPELPETDVGTTVFVRNVPFEATQDDLHTLFRAYGPLRYARITLDPEMGRSRGTGFVCFWNKEDADKVIQESELLRTETTGAQDEPSNGKKNPFSLPPSILTPDPSSTLAKNLVLHGRTLDVVRAVTRDAATKLKEEGEKRREKADKRNMYLLREGVILPNSPASGVLSAADLERRTTSFNTRKALLKSNPSLYISKTRLSIRQIPIFVTDRMLKRLASHAVKAFEADVAKGSRAGLSNEELEETDGKSSGGYKKVSKSLAVKQAKIVRQMDRVDPTTGKGRSKGYGFLEMHKHSDALRVLRWANNNPEVGQLFGSWWKEELGDLLKAEKAKERKDEARIKRINEELEKPPRGSKSTLIVEFSVENVQIVQRRQVLQKGQVQDAGSKHLAKRNSESSEEPPAKRRKTTSSQDSQPKVGSSIGFLIGRKRKQKKRGKQ